MPTFDPQGSFNPVLPPELVVAGKGTEIALTDAFIAVDPAAGTLFTLGFKYSGLTEDQIPESKADYVNLPLIAALEIYRGEEDTPLQLDVYSYGGGYTEGENGTLDISQGQTYRFPGDFVVGQEERIIVLVTFDELFGITDPVRYELDLIPMQGPLG